MSVDKPGGIFERIRTSKAKHYHPETSQELIAWLLITQVGSSCTWEQFVSYEFGDKYVKEAKEWFEALDGASNEMRQCLTVLRFAIPKCEDESQAQEIKHSLDRLERLANALAGQK